MEHIVTHAKRKATESTNEPTTHQTVQIPQQQQQQETTLMISDSASGNFIKFLQMLTRKGTQMINSNLIQTLVIDRPNLKMNNREKIIDGDSLWRFT